MIWGPYRPPVASGPLIGLVTRQPPDCRAQAIGTGAEAPLISPWSIWSSLSPGRLTVQAVRPLLILH